MDHSTKQTIADVALKVAAGIATIFIGYKKLKKKKDK